MTPWFTGAAGSGRQRFGYEIDLRFRRDVRDVAAGVDVRVAGRTRVGVSARRITYSHDPDAEFEGSNLREVLDRRTDAFGLQFQYALTPLTTFVVSGERSYDRFEFTPARERRQLARRSRDSTCRRSRSSPAAAASGIAGSPGPVAPCRIYSGVVASVAASSTIRSRTRIEVTVDRDVNYSWEAALPVLRADRSHRDSHSAADAEVGRPGAAGYAAPGVSRRD